MASIEKLQAALKGFETRYSNLQDRLMILRDEREAAEAERRKVLRRIEAKRGRLKVISNKAKVNREQQRLAALDRDLGEVDQRIEALDAETASIEKDQKRVRASQATTRLKIRERRKAERKFANRVAHRKEKLLKRMVRTPGTRDLIVALRVCERPMDDPRFAQAIAKIGGKPRDETDQAAMLELVEETLPRTTAPKVEIHKAAEQKLDRLMREVAKELKVDPLADPETHRVVRELAKSRLSA